MRLLDYADVKVGNGHWMKGWQAEDRMGGLSVEIFDVCGTSETQIIDGSNPDVYDIRAFGIKADLPRSLLCTQKDDEQWLAKMTKEAAETAVGRAACIEHADGTDTWLGDASVRAAATIEAGRVVWQAHNVGVPALHLADDQMVDALNAKVILSLGDEMMTVWGDPVVNSPGYLPGTIFWSGPIEVFLSTIDTDLLFKSSNNAAVVIANIVAALNMPPGQVVKVTAA
jgi:hypothetical protein